MEKTDWRHPSHEDIELGARLFITVLVLVGAGLELDLNNMTGQTGEAFTAIVGVIVGYWFGRSTN